MIYYLKKVLKGVIYRATSWEPLLSGWRKLKLHNSVSVLMYHEIAEDDDEIEAWTVVKKSDFCRQMKYLSRYFNVISLKEALQQIDSSHEIQQPTAVVTFDDGYKGNSRILLPLVKSMNIPVTIFISTKAVQDQIVYWYDHIIHALQGEKVLNISLQHLSLGTYSINRCKGPQNWIEIERLLKDLKTLEPSARETVVKDIVFEFSSTKADSYNMAPLTIQNVQELTDCPLITIGAHSHCHNILTQLTEDDVRDSIRISKKLLEAWINRPIYHFSYPNGNYNDIIISSLKEIGFKSSMTTIKRVWKKEESHFTIPRIGIGRYDSFEHFKMTVSGVFL